MSFSCVLCLKEGVEGYPAFVDSVQYDTERDLLIEKVVGCSTRVLCQDCFKEVTTFSSSEQHNFFLGDLKDDRFEILYEEAVSWFPDDSLHFILKHCVKRFDEKTICLMQQKDPRVSLLLRIIFKQLLRADCRDEMEFVINILYDTKLRAKCLEDFAAYYGAHGNFSYSGSLLVKAFECACLIPDETAKNKLLIRLGFDVVNLTLAYISLYNIYQITGNIFLISLIIFNLGRNINEQVFRGKTDLNLLSNVLKLFVEKQFEKASLVADELSDKDFKESVKEKIKAYQGIFELCDLKIEKFFI
jgi:hypothetical protein